MFKLKKNSTKIYVTRRNSLALDPTGAVDETSSQIIRNKKSIFAVKVPDLSQKINESKILLMVLKRTNLNYAFRQFTPTR